MINLFKIFILLFPILSFSADFVFMAADSDTVAMPIGGKFFFGDSGYVIFDTDTTAEDTGRYRIDNFLEFLLSLGVGIVRDSLTVYFHPDKFYFDDTDSTWHPRQAGLDSLFAVAGAGLSGGGTRTVTVNAGLGIETTNDSVSVKLPAGSGLVKTEAGLELDDTDDRNIDWTEDNATTMYSGRHYVNGYLSLMDNAYGITARNNDDDTNYLILNLDSNDTLRTGNSLLPNVLSGSQIRVPDLSAGFVKSSGSGILSVDTNTYLTDPITLSDSLKVEHFYKSANRYNIRFAGFDVDSLKAVFDGDELTDDHIDESTLELADLGEKSYNSLTDKPDIPATIALADSEAVLEGFLDHDDLQGVVSNEHIDWTQDQGATNINAGNYTDTDTQLSQEEVEDIVGGMLDGTEELIDASYSDLNGNIQLIVEDDLSQYDNSTSGFLTSEVDGSTTNEIEVVDETYNATNFNGGTTSAVSQDDFYDYNHISDTDDDGKPNVVDLASAGFVKTNASGVLSVDANTYLTTETGDISSVTAGTGLTGGGSSGAVTLTNLYASSNSTAHYSGNSTINGTIGVSGAATFSGQVYLGNSRYLYGRNVANTANIRLFGLNQYDQLYFGQATGIDSIVFAIGGGFGMIIDNSKNVRFYNNLTTSGDIEADEIDATWIGEDFNMNQINLTLNDPFRLSGNTWIFDYESSDFAIDGEGYFGIKPLSITYEDIADATLDSSKLAANVKDYVQEHSASIQSIGYWEYEWIKVSELKREGTLDPEWDTTFGSFANVLAFDWDEEEEVSSSFTLPVDVVTDSVAYFAVKYAPGSTTSDGIVWKFEYKKIDTGETASSEDSANIVITSGMTVNTLYLNHSGSFSLSGLNANAEIPFIFYRNTDHPSDDFDGANSDMYLVAVGLRTFRKLEND